MDRLRDTGEQQYKESTKNGFPFFMSMKNKTATDDVPGKHQFTAVRATSK